MILTYLYFASSAPLHFAGRYCSFSYSITLTDSSSYFFLTVLNTLFTQQIGLFCRLKDNMVTITGATLLPNVCFDTLSIFLLLVI